MIGWIRLARLVSSTVCEGWPLGVGRKSSSTGSRIAQSLLTWIHPCGQLAPSARTGGTIGDVNRDAERCLHPRPGRLRHELTGAFDQNGPEVQACGELLLRQEVQCAWIP